MVLNGSIRDAKTALAIALYMLRRGGDGRDSAWS